VAREAVINTLVSDVAPPTFSFVRSTCKLESRANIGFTADSLQLTQTLANGGYIHVDVAGRALVFTAAERFRSGGKSSSRKIPQTCWQQPGRSRGMTLTEQPHYRRFRRGFRPLCWTTTRHREAEAQLIAATLKCVESGVLPQINLTALLDIRAQTYGCSRPAGLVLSCSVNALEAILPGEIGLPVVLRNSTAQPT